jgi:hypothetical protein
MTNGGDLEQHASEPSPENPAKGDSDSRGGGSKAWDLVDNFETMVLEPLQKFLKATSGAQFSLVLVGVGAALASAAVWGSIVYEAKWDISQFLGLLLGGLFVIVLGFFDRVLDRRLIERQSGAAFSRVEQLAEGASTRRLETDTADPNEEELVTGHHDGTRRATPSN